MLRMTIKPVYRFHRNNDLCGQPIWQDTCMLLDSKRLCPRTRPPWSDMPEGNVVLVNQIETPRDRMPPSELSGELRVAVERWAAQQPDRPTLAEAVRRLIEAGFATD